MPVIVASSMVLSSTLKSSAVTAVLLPLVIRLPCILTSPVISNEYAGAVLNMPTLAALPSTNMAVYSAGFLAVMAKSALLTLLAIILVLGNAALENFNVN